MTTADPQRNRSKASEEEGRAAASKAEREEALSCHPPGEQVGRHLPVLIAQERDGIFGNICTLQSYIFILQFSEGLPEEEPHRV